MNYDYILKRMNDRVKAFNFSYRMLAQELGWTVSKLYNALSGKQPMTAKSLFQLAKCLDMHFVLFNDYEA